MNSVVEGVGTTSKVIANEDARRDYSGCPTAEIARLYQEISGTEEINIVRFAERIEMDVRDLKNIVIYERYPFTGWSKAEPILTGLGLDSAALLHYGDLHEVPARGSRKSAALIAADGLDEALSPAEAKLFIAIRIEEIMADHKQYVVRTAKQEEQLRKDSERIIARNKLARAAR